MADRAKLSEAEQKQKEEDERKRRLFFEQQIRPYAGQLAQTSEVLINPIQPQRPLSLPNVVFENFHTNEALIHYTQLKPQRVCILNFANATIVGGGVANGKKAQEEDLMRTSPMLYKSIAQATRRDGSRIANPTRHHRTGEEIFEYCNWGERHWNRSILISEQVQFIRNTNLDLVTPYTGDVITAAAPNHRGERNITTALADKPRIKQVIRNILATAAEKRCQVLILGAWGCGAFAPIDSIPYKRMMAEAFGEVLATSPFPFETICFPIVKVELRKIFQETITAILANPPPIIHCKAQGCIDEHTMHYCRICLNSDSDHLSSNCPSRDLSLVRCRAQGCQERHRQHYCKICKNSDSDHRSRNCPSLVRCRVQGCQERHRQHYCKICKNSDSDHRSRNCPSLVRCRVQGCQERHRQHYCRICKNSDSDHFSCNCPSKSSRGGNIDNNFIKYIKYKNKYLALAKK
jgi:uncharacterized protein (TIGR02452 family)